jgi:hypothetical protein
MMNSPLQLPLSNVQLELLKLFSDNLPETDLLEVKKLLVEWRFKKLKDAADKVWEEKGWTPEDMEKLLHQHVRTPYTAQNEFLAKQVKH